MSGGELRVGIISFAHLHAVSYAGCLAAIPDARLVAIADDDPRRGTTMAARFGVDYASDSAELLARPDIDAVIVTSENAHHAAHVIAAAAAGKHVLCEKPLATTREDALTMIAACREAGVVLQTAFPMRFSPPVIALRDAIAAGAVGEPLAVMATNHGRMPPGWFSDPILAGGGAIMDHTVHVADLLRWILGREVVSVYAEAATRMHPGIAVDDVGMLLLTFDGGLFASLDASWSRPATWPTWGGLTIEVVGDAGVIAMDAFNQNVQHYDDRDGTYRLVPWGQGGDPTMVATFVEAARTGSPPPVTGEDGLRALEVVLAAYVSAASHRPEPCPSS
ncbi:MAG: Gfo/Idh/MocA family oxidoreductase [Chloroflexia bacterium]|nr:Gfo/Idh/MocA family oxidoreductase [Chloroflexia bacterium]MDQ3514508.1 Gfo/Idh/MocA family oxidoreductase [Chloroflexota bacterium]